MTVINKSGEVTFSTNLWNGYLRFFFSAANGNVVANISTNQWYFIYLYYDQRNGEIGMSLNNGSPVRYRAANGINNGTNPFFLGATGFDGDLDEWGVWDRLLRPDELAYLYSNGAGRSYPFANLNPPEGIWIDWNYSYGISPVHGVTSVDQSGQ
jgi:hypothetical protein